MEGSTSVCDSPLATKVIAHVSIAKKMWRVYLKQRSTAAGQWARYSARVHLAKAREVRV